MTDKKFRSCPQCGTKMEVHIGYVTWCAECEWNLNTESLYKPKSIIEKVSMKLGQNFDDKFHQQTASDLSSKSSFSLGYCFAYLLASFVHILTFTTLLIAVWLFIIAQGNWFLYALGLLSAAVFWLLKPFDFKKVHVKGITESDFPEFYALVNSLNSQLGIKHTYEILIDHKFNASISLIKNSKKRVLTIGMPLWSILSPNERVALLAHELAHDVNGDITRQNFIHSALYTLNVWYSLCKPDSKPFTIVETLLWFISCGFKHLIRILIEGYTWLMLVFVWRDSQRAEYLADFYAAEIAGSDASLNLLRKLYMSNQVNNVIASSTLNNASDDFFTALKNKFDYVPPIELERIKRLEQNSNIRLDATHPQTNKRQTFINNNFIHVPKYTLSKTQSSKIDKEFSSLEKDIINKLVDEYRYSLLAYI